MIVLVLILHCMPVVMLICLISYLCRLKALKSLCCTVACAPTLNKSCLMSYVLCLKRHKSQNVKSFQYSQYVKIF